MPQASPSRVCTAVLLLKLTRYVTQESNDVATVGTEGSQSPASAILYPMRLAQLGAEIRTQAATALAPAAATAPYVSQARPPRMCRLPGKYE